jgi:hypothetical protein
MSLLTGYNAPIPDMEAREQIKEKLVQGFEDIRGPDDGMAIFGSFKNIKGTHEDSDIDFLVYRHNEMVFTSDGWLFDLGRVVANATGEYSGMKIDSNIADRATTEDGRFSAAGRILNEIEKGDVYGKEFRDRINRIELLIPEEGQIGFGLRKVRAEIVRAFSRAARKDEEGLRKSFRSALTSFSSLHYLLRMLTPAYGINFEGFMQSITDNDDYRHISNLKRDLDKKLEIEEQGLDTMLNYMVGVKGFYETCINKLMKYPYPGRREMSF